MTNCEKYGLNEHGVFTKYEVAVSHGTEYERSAVLLAQNDDGYWHYGLDRIDGGFHPGINGTKYSDRQTCIDAGREHLLKRLREGMKWYDNVPAGSSGAEGYGARARLYKEHINAIMQQSLF